MLSDGWALQWDDASRGNKFTHWLTKGDARMCLCAKEIGGCRCGAARNEIYLFPVTADEQWTRTEGRRPIKTFCKVAEPDGALVTKRAVDGMSKTKPKPPTSGKSALSAAATPDAARGWKSSRPSAWWRFSAKPSATTS